MALAPVIGFITERDRKAWPLRHVHERWRRRICLRPDTVFDYDYDGKLIGLAYYRLELFQVLRLRRRKG